MQEKLRECGYLHFPHTSPELIIEALDSLGEVIQTTEIRHEPSRPGILPSSGSIGFHTDHFRADFVVWHCLRPADSGGDTLLADAEAGFSALNSNEQKALKDVPFCENRVFEKDPESHAFLTFPDGVRKFYFSFWPCEEAMSDIQHQSLERFIESIQTLTPINLSLKANEFLVVDNCRMLHGRTAITGATQRLLRRYWVQRHKLE